MSNEKGNRAYRARGSNRLQIFLLLFLSCVFIATAFESTFRGVILADTATEQARLEAAPAGGSQGMGSSLQASSSQQVVADARPSQHLTGAEPLLLLLLGSVLFCAAAGVSLVASRSGSDKSRT